MLTYDDAISDLVKAEKEIERLRSLLRLIRLNAYHPDAVIRLIRLNAYHPDAVIGAVNGIQPTHWIASTGPRKR